MDNNIIWRMLFTFWVSKATRARAQANAPPRADIHTEVCNTDCFFVNAPQCYVTRTLPLLFYLSYSYPACFGRPLRYSEVYLFIVVF